MRTTRLLLLYFLLLSPISLIGQTSFWKQWQATVSIITNPSLSEAEKLDTSLVFLKTALANQDQVNELCGYGLLFHTYMNMGDYANANLSLKQAEALAIESRSPAQLGWVKHKQAVLDIRLINFEKAKTNCLISIEQCAKGKDSICLALSHEQAGSIYGVLDKFDSATIHFEMAQTLLTKFVNENHMAAFNNNYANMHSRKGQPAMAVPYLEEAINYYRASGQTKTQAKSMNNLARVHLKLKDYSLARTMYEECVELNKKNDFADNLISNYNGLFDLAYETNNMKEAFHYLDTYYELKDSLVGAQTQREIADLELNYTNQKLELELAKKEANMLIVESKLERISMVLTMGAVLLAALLSFLWWRAKVSQERMLRDKENLTSLTKVIFEKNENLIELQEKIRDYQSSTNETNGSELELNLFNMRILTDSDWAAFQSSFEKVYPRYIQGLRRAFPSIAESEERLFLFIKLNLSRKEAASILGITADSVKKTRNRLRKRLELSAEQNLDEYVHSFKPKGARVGQPA